MPDLSKITLPNNTTYDLKDAKARIDISALQTTVSAITGAVGGVSFLGETTTPLTDLSTTNPVEINGQNKTAVNGSLVVYQKKEFLFDGTQWIELGDLTALGALATKDSASGPYTPAGTISGGYLENTQVYVTGDFVPAGAVSINVTKKTTHFDSKTYTPSGNVAAPTISVKTAGSTATVNSITSVGTLPAFGATVSDEILTLSWSAGTLPSKGANLTVKTSDAVYQASAPTFTGNSASIQTSIDMPNTYTASFSGASQQLELNGNVKFASVTGATFTGTSATITVS